jgi:putative oxidoreductase
LMFGPLSIRILAGIAFLVAGLPKFENISVNQGFFGSLRLPLNWFFLLLY